MEQKDRTAVLFPNERQREGKQDPHFTGSLTLGGVTYWLSGWRNKTDAGKHYMSLKIGDVKVAVKKAPAEDRRPAPPTEDDGWTL